ncbi:MASE1 domain-containing protein [Bacillus sp. NP157]|nr:MASE1 domain-containing protein [Bacillus sp. NP157]
MNGGSTKHWATHATYWQRWGRHLAVAAAYGATYELARYVSFPQWMLTAGLRLAALLLLPVRYWPALALGEALPLLESAAIHEPDLGLPWAVSASVPMVVLWMALLKPLTRRWSLHDERGQVRMPLILGAALGSAFITSAATLLTAFSAILNTPTGAWPDPSTGPAGYFLAYTLGAFLGALTLTPVVLAMHERFRALGGKPLSWRVIWRSPLLRDLLGWALPAAAALTLIAVTTHDDGVRQAARLFLIAPTLGLAWRHGWHGTAVGGMAASIALALTASGLLVDPATLQAQSILALAVSGALLTRAKARTMATPATARVPRH